MVTAPSYSSDSEGEFRRYHASKSIRSLPSAGISGRDGFGGDSILDDVLAYSSGSFENDKFKTVAEL